MKKEEVASKTEGLSDLRYVIKGHEVHLDDRRGKLTVSSEEGSMQEVDILDGQNTLVETLAPGNSLTEDFRHYVKMVGTSSSDRIKAYIHVDD